MADIDLTLKTTQVVIVSAFVILTIYFNFVLVRSSLDVLFWATITSMPLIGLKNSAAFISPYLANLNYFKKHHMILFILIFGKNIIYDRNQKSILFVAFVALYIIMEKSMRKTKFSNQLKLSIVAALIAIASIATLNSIVCELKFVATTFNIKGIVNEQNLKYLNDLVTPNLEKLAEKLKQNNNIMPKLQKCGFNYERMKITDLKDINLTESYKILACLSTEYKKQLITIAKTSQPMIIKAVKKIITLGENSLAAISLFMTFASTVYIMTKKSIQPMHVVDAFLSLIDDSGYLSAEFKEIVHSLIFYYFQKFLITGFSTFLTFTLFSMNIIAIPTILSALSILVPGAPTYLIPLIGIFELLFLHKPYWYIILFVIACNRIKKYCDSLISLKVSLINSKLKMLFMICRIVI